MATTVSNDVRRIFEKTQTLTGATTLTAADSGKTFWLNAANGAAISLPALKEGAYYRFVVAANFDTSDWVITPSDADKINGTIVVNGASVNADATDSVTFELGAESLGDFVEFRCDGSNWLINGVGNSASSITTTG
jgi:hypothetical protein